MFYYVYLSSSNTKMIETDPESYHVVLLDLKVAA